MVVKIMQLPADRYVALGVQANGTTDVDIFSIPQDVEISDVWARVAVTGTGAANMILGDDDDDNGYLEAADHTAAAGTIIGDIQTEWGAYQAVNPGTDDSPLPAKKYTSAGKELKLKLSASGTIQSIWDVYWKMSRIPAST